MKKTVLSLFLLSVLSLTAQSPWEESSYPDEWGFKQRIAGAIEQLSRKPFLQRSMSHSVCPDTGLPVFTWALEGEEITSPYTGRRYKQGDTGYFGPKQRNKQGEIVAFGGDPLKQALPPATARLMLNPSDSILQAYLSIPGNLNQQYHFAAANWARFYGLMGEKMPPLWQKRFQEAVSIYAERRRPSDGAREHLPMERAMDLVGWTDEKEGVLGGGFTNGGTENHKLMWRTSALVYAALFPPTATISGHSTSETQRVVMEMMTQFFHKLLTYGNGEYDSQIYYPHSLYSFLNMYDFVRDPRQKAFAKFALDYWLATYALKTVSNTVAGAQKRGYLSDDKLNEMETFTYIYGGKNKKSLQEMEVHLPQATTSYRPNRIITRLLRNDLTFPFEAQIARPSYHCNERNVFQESFFRSQSYALGNVAMTVVDNPNQQVVWSLVAEGENGPLCFGGQQPCRMSPSGHSPYTQTVHHRRSLILMTADTGNKPSRTLSREEEHRFAHASDRLIPLCAPVQRTVPTMKEYFNGASRGAASWLFIPLAVERVIERNGKLFIQAGTTFVVVYPLSKYDLITASSIEGLKGTDTLFAPLDHYSVLSVHGTRSGYIIDSDESKAYPSFEAFIKKVESRKRISHQSLKVEYTTLEGDRIALQYMDTGLRAKAWINGTPVDYDAWADGYVYNSPYLKTGNGKMFVSDGTESYQIDFTGSTPLHSAETCDIQNGLSVENRVKR